MSINLTLTKSYKNKDYFEDESQSGGYSYVGAGAGTDFIKYLTDNNYYNSANFGKTEIDALNIDADKLDGAHGSQFLRSDQGGTLTGNLEINGNLEVTGNISASGEVLAFIVGSISETIWDYMPAATASAIGGIKIASPFGITNGVLTIDSSNFGLNETELGAYLTANNYFSSASFVDNSSQWNTAYNWGDHAGLYSLLSHAHSNYLLNTSDTLTGALGFIDNSYTEPFLYKSRSDASQKIGFVGKSGGSLGIEFSDSEKVTITTLGDIYSAGNLQYHSNNSNINSIDWSANNLRIAAGSKLYTYGDSSGSYLSYNTWTTGSGAVSIINTSTTGVFNIATDSLTRFTILADGKIGLNKALPATSLHLVTDSGITLHSITNGLGAKMIFSDHAASSYDQYGTLTYLHSDAASYGGGNAFVFGTSTDHLKLVVNGSFVYSNGIYKSADGASAGVNMSDLWDIAYNYSVKTNITNKISFNNTAAYSFVGGAAYSYGLMIENTAATVNGGAVLSLRQGSFDAQIVARYTAGNAGRLELWAESDNPYTYDSTANITYLQNDINLQNGNFHNEVLHATNASGKIKLTSKSGSNEYGIGLEYSLDGSGNPSQYIRSYYGANTYDNIRLLNDSSVRFGGDVNPAATASKNLGTTSLGWQFLYLTGNINQIGTSAQMDVNPYRELRLGRSTNNTDFAFTIYRGNNTTSANSKFRGYGDSYVNYLTGDFGIGTASPSAKAHIYSTTTTANLFLSGLLIEAPNTGTEVGVAMRTGDVAAGNYWYAGLNQNGTRYSVAYGTAFTDSVTKLTVTSEGKVGVLNVSPYYNLDVSGSARVTNTIYSGSILPITANVSTIGNGSNYYLGVYAINHYTSANHGYGFGFWGSDSYKIFMSAKNSNPHGTVVELDTTADYNMYFRMSGSGRGFVFYNGSNSQTAAAQITGAGNILAKGEITAYSTSDKRLKTDINTIENAIDLIKRFNPISFKWNAQAKALNSTKDNRINYGLIAQEVAKTNPELAHRIYDKYNSLDYTGIIPILIKAIQELNEKIEKNGLTN